MNRPSKEPSRSSPPFKEDHSSPSFSSGDAVLSRKQGRAAFEKAEEEKILQDGLKGPEYEEAFKLYLSEDWFSDSASNKEG